MKAPKGLQSRGRAFWRRVTERFQLSDAELELLVEVCRTLDLVDTLEESIREGVTVAGSRGQPRPNPAVGEVRQQRLVLGRLLAQLQLPEDESPPSAETLRGRHAAESRWAQTRALREARHGTA